MLFMPENNIVVRSHRHFQPEMPETLKVGYAVGFSSFRSMDVGSTFSKIVEPTFGHSAHFGLFSGFSKIFF